MKIQSISKRGNFKLWDDDHEILNMKYVNWFNNQATTKYNRQKIEIKPKHFFSSEYIILKNEMKIGNILFNWNGHIFLEFKDHASVQRKFILRSKSLWKRKFELLDHNKNIIMDLIGENNWSSMSYDYDVERFGDQLQTDYHELLAYVGFGANLHATMTNSAG